MVIPCKITPEGDKDCARHFIGAAQSQLRILENEMSFLNLKQGIRRVRLNPRVTVKAIVCFDLREVIIYCLPIGREGEKELAQECFCCCCWAMGFIIGYTEEEHICDDEGCNDCEIRYDVRVCQKNRYSLFQGCIPTDFAHYQIGEQVFVIVANSATDTWGYTEKDSFGDLFILSNMTPPMFFGFDEYKTSAQKNDFEKCEECERKQECKDETIRNCEINADNKTEGNNAACMTEKITIITHEYGDDEIIQESRKCGEYQFKTGSACRVSKDSNIPPFYIVPIGCEKELGKWSKTENMK